MKQGRYWIYAWKQIEGVDFEVPSAVLDGRDHPEIVDVGGHPLRFISLDDLMMDRLVQATDRTPTTWDEVIELGEATFDRVNWDKIRARCMVKRKEDIGLHILPLVLVEVLDELAALHREIKDTGPSLDYGF